MQTDEKTVSFRCVYTYIYTSLIEVKFLEILMLLRGPFDQDIEWNERGKWIRNKSKITKTAHTQPMNGWREKKKINIHTSSITGEKPIHMCLRDEYVVRNILIRSSTCASGLCLSLSLCLSFSAFILSFFIFFYVVFLLERTPFVILFFFFDFLFMFC